MLRMIRVCRVLRVLCLLRYDRGVELFLGVVELLVDVGGWGTVCAGELGHDGLELGWGEDAGVAQELEFGADGAEGSVDLCWVGHAFG